MLACDRPPAKRPRVSVFQRKPADKYAAGTRPPLCRHSNGATVKTNIGTVVAFIQGCEKPFTMVDSATAKKMARPGASFARRYGLAFVSVSVALFLELLFHHFNLPHPFAAFALTAIAITFWYGGIKPGIVAVLLSSLIRGYIFEAETSSLSRVLYELVFLTFAILMIWVRRRKESRSRTELPSSRQRMRACTGGKSSSMDCLSCRPTR